MSVPCIYGCHTYHTERMQQNRTCHKSQLASLNVWDWETLGEVLFRGSRASQDRARGQLSSCEVALSRAGQDSLIRMQCYWRSWPPS